jgi:hypothetical protein
MKVLYILLLCLISSSANAKVKMHLEEGGATHGGGGGILCRDFTRIGQADLDAYLRTASQDIWDERLLLKFPEVNETLVLADYYEAMTEYTGNYKKPRELSEESHWDGFSKLNPDEHFQLQTPLVQFSGILDEQDALKEVLSMLRPLGSFSFELGKRINQLQTINYWKSSKLEVLEDHNFKIRLPSEFPKYCKYVQIAIRTDSVVQVNPILLAKLAPSQRALLRVHEALYKWIKDVNKDVPDSSMVRVLISRFIEILYTKEFLEGDVFTANNYEYHDLCKIASRLGLCTVDKVFSDYIDDLFRPSESIVITNYVDSASAVSAAKVYSQKLLRSDSFRFTLPVLYDRMDEIHTAFDSYVCSDLIGLLPVENTYGVKEAATSVRLGINEFRELNLRCNHYLSILKSALAKYQNGFSHRFCYKASGKSLCKTIKVNPTKANYFLQDGMDEENFLEIENFVDQYFKKMLIPVKL